MYACMTLNLTSPSALARVVSPAGPTGRDDMCVYVCIHRSTYACPCNINLTFSHGKDEKSVSLRNVAIQIFNKK